jgi:hypothetical protein
MAYKSKKSNDITWIFVQDSVFVATILCEHAMCMEPFVFSEVFFPSEVYQNISRSLHNKNKHIVTFLSLQPVILFLFLGIKRQGREFHHLPQHMRRL